MTEHEELIDKASIKAHEYMKKNHSGEDIEIQKLICKVFLEGFIQGIVSYND